VATPTPSDDESWRVYSLCAAWCGVCNQWRSAFDELARTHPAMQFTWIDIEDESDTLGDLDVETFPTLLVARGRTPHFYGPVLPSATQCQRLLASVQADPGASVTAPEADGLLLRLLNRG